MARANLSMSGDAHPVDTVVRIYECARRCSYRRGIPIKARSVASIHPILQNCLDRAFLDETSNYHDGNIGRQGYFH